MKNENTLEAREEASGSAMEWTDFVHIDAHAGRTLRSTLRSGAGLKDTDDEEENPVHPFILAHDLNNRAIDNIVGQATEEINPVHLAQEIHLHRTLPHTGTVQVRTRLKGVRVTSSGTLMATSSLILGNDGEPIAESVTNALLPGVSSLSSLGDVPMPRPTFPSSGDSGGASFFSKHVATPEWINLYAQVSGDQNPIHTDPKKARESGFATPIAHGMGILGILCEKASEELLEGNISSIQSVGVRFSSPIPMDTPFHFSVKSDTKNKTIRFSCHTEKGIAMKNGFLTLFPNCKIQR